MNLTIDRHKNISEAVDDNAFTKINCELNFPLSAAQRIEEGKDIGRHALLTMYKKRNGNSYTSGHYKSFC